MPGGDLQGPVRADFHAKVAAGAGRQELRFRERSWGATPGDGGGRCRLRRGRFPPEPLQEAGQAFAQELLPAHLVAHLGGISVQGLHDPPQDTRFAVGWEFQGDANLQTRLRKEARLVKIVKIL